LELGSVPFPTAPLHVILVRFQVGIFGQPHFLKASERHPILMLKLCNPLLSLSKLVFQFLDMAFYAQLDDVLPYLGR